MRVRAKFAQWLSGRIHLPAETVAYVQIVTGRPISEWTSTQSPSWAGPEIPKGVPCTSLADLRPSVLAGQNESSTPKVSAWAAWGVQLLGDFTQAKLLVRYKNLRRKYSTVLGDEDPLVVLTNGPSGRTRRYLARVAGSTQHDAEQLCRRLQAVGGSCLVVRNS